MRLTKHVFLLAALGLLVIGGVAAAQVPAAQTTDVSAVFNVTQTRMRTHTCTQGTDTFRVTNAVWRGTSTSTEPRLAGNLVLATHSVLNETTGDGWLSGDWRTRPAAPARPGTAPRSHALLSAVIDNGNHVDGLVIGGVRSPGARLLGNLSATINGTAMAGDLGANAPVAPDNSALIFSGGCPGG